MLKKFFGLTLMFLMIASNCLAMTFSQPVRIGYAGSRPYIGQSSHFKGGYFIEGASYNSGNIVTHGKNLSNTKTYKEGLARWGEGSDALYCKYDSKDGGGLNFGGKDNYIFSEKSWRDISKIETDEGITLYVLYYRYKYFAELAILGCLKDGTWVKYIDMDVNFSKKYFGDNFREVNYGPEDWNYLKDISTYIRCQGDTIIVPYFVVGYNPYRTIQTGEFRFKWDNAAQWFGVEKITY